MTLEEYLEANCRYLETAIEDVSSGEDLPPVFAFEKDDVTVMVPPALDDKALAVGLFKTLIKSVGAERYAIISAAWYVALDPQEITVATALIDREGTGTKYKDRRRECYWISVGDRERSLIACFDVERDYKGKIRRLLRRPSPKPADFVHGRMTDLLIEARH
jgi:hypothetical protein